MVIWKKTTKLSRFDKIITETPLFREMKILFQLLCQNEIHLHHYSYINHSQVQAPASQIYILKNSNTHAREGSYNQIVYLS